MKLKAHKKRTYFFVGALLSLSLHICLIIFALFSKSYKQKSALLSQKTPEKKIKPIFFKKEKEEKNKYKISARQAGIPNKKHKNKTKELSMPPHAAKQDTSDESQEPHPKKTQKITKNRVSTPSLEKPKQTKKSVATFAKKTEPINTEKAPKKKLSLADLHKNFMQYMQGNDSITVKSSYNGAMDVHDLNILNYMRQMAKNIQATLQYTTQPSVPKAAHGTQTTFTITVNRQGKVTQVAIVQSCGFPMLDTYIQDLIYQAGPFPPVPKFIKGTTLKTNWYMDHIKHEKESYSSFMWYR